ncbi:Ms4527A family Cys-rich leader peptide [Mycobacterium paragordonae]|uniref:Ms4527A family Cys-rich leader peptide n=1 Tax=Mycobacterium paragordonae TaxID=1389713 RepID=UPI00351B27BC
MDVEAERSSGRGLDGRQFHRHLDRSHAKSWHDGPTRAVFPGSSLVCLPKNPGSARSFNHCEKKFDLVAPVVWIHGRMAAVTVAKSSPRVALVVRRHIDLKRVCSCCCLP